MTATATPSGDLVRTVLEIVEQGDGRFGWREIATRLALRDLYRQEELCRILAEMEVAGLLFRVRRTDGPDHWLPTGRGSALPGPADEGDTDPLLAALLAGPEAALHAARRLVDEPAGLEAALRRAVDRHPEAAGGAAIVASCLPPAARDALIHDLSHDARPVARRGLFGAWAPHRMEAPGGGWQPLPDAPWQALLRRGLTDPDLEVRALATLLVFATGQAAGLLDELLANLDAGDPLLRRRSLLALGCAMEGRTFAALRASFLGREANEAGAAVRALAARPDGRGDWRAALDDPREPVRRAAVFALGRVVEGLSGEELAVLESSTRPEQAAAAAACRQRSRGVDG